MEKGRKIKDARHEMSVFLERQSVRRKRNITKRLRQFERVLLSVAFVLAGLACLYGLYVALFMGDTFTIKKIVVDGKWRYLSATGLAELSGVKEGDNLFWISTNDVHEKLSLDPWVRSAAVVRRLPDTLWIFVEEHEPFAIASFEDGLFYVSKDGTLFKKLEQGDDKNFPVFTGIAMKGGILEEDGASCVNDMISLVSVFRSLAFGRGKEIAEVHFDNVAGFSIITRDEPMQILFGKSNFADHAAKLDEMFFAITERGKRIQYLLANESNRVVVRYQSS